MRFLFIFLFVLSLLACSQKKSSSQTSFIQTEVVRNTNRQPALKVVGRTNNSVEADHKLFEEQGYQTAYDRFLQMDFFRRSARARLAELLGKDAVDKDLATMGQGFTVSIANSSIKLKKREPEAYAFLETYAKGVNRFLQNIERLRPQWVTLYRKLMGDSKYVPSPWTPEDSISVGTFLTFYLSNQLGEKFSMGAIYFLLNKLNYLEYFNNLIDLRPISKTFIFDKPPAGFEIRESQTEKFQAEVREKGSAQVVGEPFDLKGSLPNCYRESAAGSNNWAISKDFTGTNETYLSNDPHLLLLNPNIMHEVALDSRSAGGTIYARGVTPPGAVGILIGHNQDIAWGATNNPADVDDLSVVALNKEETQYINSNGVWSDLDIQVINHQVKGEPNATVLKLKSIPERGILISDFISPIKNAALAFAKDRKGFLRNEIKEAATLGIAYRWVGHEGGSELAAILALNRARNFVDFKRALDFFESGAQNFVYADRQGNIGYYSHANFPVRTYLDARRPPYVPTISFEKVRRADEPDKESVWSGYRSHYLEAYNPAKGFIVTANNDPVGMSQEKNHYEYSNYLGFGYDFGFRARRITDLIEGIKKDKNKIELEDMKKIQTDVKDLFALHLLELVQKLDLKATLTDKDQIDVVTKLLAWDGESLDSKVEPGFLYYWVVQLAKEYFKFNRMFDSRPQKNVTDILVKEFAKGPWSDSVYPLMKTSIPYKSMVHYLEMAANSKEKAVQGAAKKILSTALANTISVLKRHQMFNVTWGKLNTLVLNDPWEGIFPLAIDKTVLERGGSFATVAPSRPTVHYGSFADISSSEKKMETNAAFGASLRILYKLKAGEPIQSQVVLPGNWNYEENPAPALQELQLWNKGGYRDLVSFIE